MFTISRSVRVAVLSVASIAITGFPLQAGTVTTVPATPCSTTMPSCAPRPAWWCIHPGFQLFGYCDPDSKGCLDDE